jgi:hypothetical protein
MPIVEQMALFADNCADYPFENLFTNRRMPLLNELLAWQAIANRRSLADENQVD